MKIKLLRNFTWAGDERDPFIVTVSRVPCKGETIHTTGRGDPAKHGPSYYVVEKVMHYADYPNLAAAVTVELHKDLGPPDEPLPPEALPGPVSRTNGPPRRAPYSSGMKIKLLRDFNQAGDERDPFIVTVSRVPCKGETIHTTGRGDPAKHGPSYYVVEKVMHHADYPNLAATVTVVLHEIHKDLGPPAEPLPPEQRLGKRRKKSA